MTKKHSKHNAFYRSDVDRRSGDERRTSFSLNYSENGEPERRSGYDRRKSSEKRFDWVRYSKWRSVFIGG